MDETAYECLDCGEQVPVQNRIVHDAVCRRHAAANPPDASKKEQETPPTVSKVQETPRTACEGQEAPPPAPVATDVDTENALLKCEFCELEVPMVQLNDHEELCGARTDVCTRCMHYVRNRDAHSHRMSGCAVGATASALPPDHDAADSGGENQPLLPPRASSTARTRRPRTQGAAHEQRVDDALSEWGPLAVAVGAVAAAAAFGVFATRR